MSHSRSLVEVNPSMKIVKELSYEELLQKEASRLPERDTMDLISLNLAAPINAAVAANVLVWMRRQSPRRHRLQTSPRTLTSNQAMEARAGGKAENCLSPPARQMVKLLVDTTLRQGDGGESE
jgi:hypothetical protein